MDSELFGKVRQRIKAVTGIKAFLILPVTAFHLAVVAGRVGTDQLVPDTELGGSGLKQGRDLPVAARETVGKFKAIVCLDPLHLNTPALDHPFQEVSGGERWTAQGRRQGNAGG